jgi:hypothetical protein
MGNTTPSGQKRKRDDDSPSQQNHSIEDGRSNKVSRKSPPPAITSSTPKKSVSLNEYKKRKNNSTSSNGPLTPTFQKTQHSYVVDSPRQPDTKPRDANLDADALNDKSQKYVPNILISNRRYLARGTSLKREADKLNRKDPITAAVTATHAVLYFMSAFACDDQSRKLRGKLQMHENWKTTSNFIVWVISLQKDSNENELEGLWYYPTTQS